MENSQTVDLRVDDAIALCHIIDKFESFNCKLIKFLTGKKDNSELILKLWKLSTGQRCITTKKMREFYNANKSVIDIINKYSNILYFICQNYTLSKDNINIDDNYYLFYKYILENKNELDKILAVLTKIKELGFSMFEFNKNADFSNETYSIPSNTYICRARYLDNLKAIPNYNNQTKYRTTDSHYLIELTISMGKIPSGENNIILNDLTFDVNRLPKTLISEDIVQKILALPQTKQEECSIIKNSVDLSVGIEDLYSMYREIQSKFNKLEGVDSKPEFLEELRKIKESIDQMKVLSQEYDKQMITSNVEITETLLTEEKKEYVRRREFSKLHID